MQISAARRVGPGTRVGVRGVRESARPLTRLDTESVDAHGVAREINERLVKETVPMDELRAEARGDRRSR
jgi:hypothetical protein